MRPQINTITASGMASSNNRQAPGIGLLQFVYGFPVRAGTMACLCPVCVCNVHRWSNVYINNRLRSMAIQLFTLKIVNRQMPKYEL